MQERGGAKKCRNPTGNLWTSALKGCGQAVCRKKGGRPQWDICPSPVTRQDLDEVENRILIALKTTEKNLERLCAAEGTSTTSGYQPLENVVIFEENGETFEQKESYNPVTKEAVLAVPAHGHYPATRFIMQGRSSDSPVAGKMIVSTKSECHLEDLPDEVHPEHIEKTNRRRIDARNMKTVKKYRIKKKNRKATEEELEILSEIMKSECAGKTVVVGSIETIHHEEFLENLDLSSNFKKSLRRVNTNETLQKSSRNGCAHPYYGCAHTNTSYHCVRWSHGTGDQPLIVHFHGNEHYCVKCCNVPNTIYLPCDCIDNQQKFSTAFAISRERDGFGYDCIKRSFYCKWDPAKVPGCDYTSPGSCIDENCPMECSAQDHCNE